MSICFSFARAHSAHPRFALDFSAISAWSGLRSSGERAVPD
jgi:hypothetical protein